MYLYTNTNCIYCTRIMTDILEWYKKLTLIQGNKIYYFRTIYQENVNFCSSISLLTKSLFQST